MYKRFYDHVARSGVRRLIREERTDIFEITCARPYERCGSGGGSNGDPRWLGPRFIRCALAVISDAGMTDDRGSGHTPETDATGERERVVESRPMIDDVFEALADWRRREICQFFRETDAETATVDDLAILVAGCRPGGVYADRSHGDVVAELADHHLPLLAGAGVVDFDDRSGTVRYRGQPTAEKWLEHVAAVDRRTG